MLKVSLLVVASVPSHDPCTSEPSYFLSNEGSHCLLQVLDGGGEGACLVNFPQG